MSRTEGSAYTQKVRLLGLSLLGHVCAVVLWGALLVAGIFFVDGVPGTVLILTAVALVLVGVVFMEWRTYKERSGPAFPRDRGFRGR